LNYLNPVDRRRNSFSSLRHESALFNDPNLKRRREDHK
jgi:hypothetical protein